MGRSKQEIKDFQEVKEKEMNIRLDLSESYYRLFRRLAAEKNMPMSGLARQLAENAIREAVESGVIKS